jgi:hypothetical protein
MFITKRIFFIPFNNRFLPPTIKTLQEQIYFVLAEEEGGLGGFFTDCGRGGFAGAISTEGRGGFGGGNSFEERLVARNL